MGKTSFNSQIQESSEFPPERDRYHLYIGNIVINSLMFIDPGQDFLVLSHTGSI